MNKKFSIISFFIVLCSCNPFNGEIKNTEQSAFLVNTSKDKKLKFTIKRSIKVEEEKEYSNIIFYELEPGEEKKIGETVSVSQKNFTLRSCMTLLRNLNI